MEARGIPGICHLSLFRSNLHAVTCMIVFLLVPLPLLGLRWSKWHLGDSGFLAADPAAFDHLQNTVSCEMTRLTGIHCIHRGRGESPQRSKKSLISSNLSTCSWSLTTLLEFIFFCGHARGTLKLCTFWWWDLDLPARKEIQEEDRSWNATRANRNCAIGYNYDCKILQVIFRPGVSVCPECNSWRLDEEQEPW